MPMLLRVITPLLALVSLTAGCDRKSTPAAKGEACRYAADTQVCAKDLYCHPTRDSEGALVLEAEGAGKKSAVGTCQPLVAADAACTKDSVCVDGYTCGFEDPTVDEGRCIADSKPK